MNDPIEKDDATATPHTGEAPPAAGGQPGPSSGLGRPHRKWNPRAAVLEATAYRVSDPRIKSPFLAAFLSLIPGLGQIYMGYYTRGFVNPLVIGSVLSYLVFTSSGTGGQPPLFFPLGILFLVFYWLYNIIDAWRRASMYNLTLEGFENVPLPDDMSPPALGGSIFGGVVLLIGGLVVLMHTRFGMPIEVLEQWWPLAPILFGGYLIFRGYQDNQAKANPMGRPADSA